jgi:2-oxoisovalerate dehydrogenase E1 component
MKSINDEFDNAEENIRPMATDTNVTPISSPTAFDPIDVFQQMIMARTINETLKARKTQGRFPFYIGTGGHEALAGGVAALRSDDWIAFYYRDLAGWMQRTHDPFGPIRAAYARVTDPMSTGRNMPEHFSSRRFNILPTFSEVSGLAPFAAGVAFSFQRRQTGQIAVFCTGDGGVATNDFNVLYRAATIHKLPIIMIVEDNGWAITTPTEGHQWGGNLVEWARAGGAHAIEMDGTNAIALHDAMVDLAEYARSGQGPVLLHLKMGLLDAHSSSTDIYAYRNRNEIAQTKKTRDPIVNTGRVLIEHGLLTQAQIDQMMSDTKDRLSAIEEQVEAEPEPTGSRLMERLYYLPFGSPIEPTGATRPMNMLQAIDDALVVIARHDPDFFVYGQDVGSSRGGVFGATQSLVNEKPSAAISSPLNEQIILGIAAGASMAEGKTRCGEIQFVDYHQSCAQSLRLAGRIAYQSFGDWTCPVLIRTKAGSGGGGPISDSGAGGGAFGHSHSGEYWFTTNPGIITVCPSTPYDAKGLLIEATRAQSPVVFLERGRLYRSDPPRDPWGLPIAALANLWQVPDGYYTVPLRQARRIRIGEGMLTGAIVTWGTMTLESAIAAANTVARYGGAFDIIDLRTLYPFDETTIADVVCEANRVVVVTEEGDHTSFGRHLHSWIVERHFDDLDMPAAYICAKGVPAAPYNRAEEEAFYPTAKDIESVLVRFATA